MASLETSEGGYYKLKTIFKGKRRTIYLGRVSKRDAQTIKINVEQLQSSRVAGVAIAPMQALWLSEITGSKLHDRLVELGLADQAQRASEDITLVDFWSEYIDSQHMAEQTSYLYANTLRDISGFFGAEKLIKDITSDDVRKLRSWFQKRGQAEATWRKKLSRLKTILGAAIKQGVISGNNPVEMPTSAYANKAKRVFIESETIEAVLPEASQSLKTVLILCRYGGFRLNEALQFRLEWVDWKNHSMTVHSKKTPPIRKCPLFPVVRDHLKSLSRKKGIAAAGYEGKTDALARKELGVLLDKKEIARWPRLFQQLRSSRLSELLQDYDLASVASWLGNSPKVAAEFYLTERQSAFLDAAKNG
ncbi:MAG: tyrosine-type recombinase/integrase [Rubripirellula sp.]